MFNMCVAVAGVDFVETEQKQIKTILKLPSRKIEFITYNGRLDATLENERYVTGNLFQNGKAIYVNGELLNGVIYLYDNQGKRYVLNVDKNN